MPQVQLLSYQSSFLDPFIAWRNEPLAVQHNPFKQMCRDEIAAMLESEGSSLTDLTKYASYRWFVEVEREVVGSISLKNISHSMGYAEIGYGIGEAFQGKGMATAAVGFLVNRIFRETSLRKLTALVHDKNRASRRVLEKLGFRQEGLLREHYLIRGNPVDEVFYGLLKQDWARLE